MTFPIGAQLSGSYVLQSGSYVRFSSLLQDLRYVGVTGAQLNPLILIDFTPPVVTNCPGNKKIYASTLANKKTAYVGWAEPVFTDPLGISSVVANCSIFRNFTIGNTTVGYTATDNSGNVNTDCTFVIQVVDNVPPSIVCPPNQTYNLSADSSTVTLTASDLTPNASTYSDNSGDSAYTLSTVLLQGYMFGTSDVVRNVTDVNGNVLTCECVKLASPLCDAEFLLFRYHNHHRARLFPANRRNVLAGHHGVHAVIGRHHHTVERPDGKRQLRHC